MNIVVFTKDRGSIGGFSISRAGLLSGVLIALIVIPAALVYTGYRLATGEPELSAEELLASWQMEQQEQRQQVGEALRASEENMNALSLQLGRMQAHVIRLDALGQRLTTMAKLDKGEFNFDNAPAVGGPNNPGELQSVSIVDFRKSLDELIKQIDDRSQQLAILETMMMNRNLQAEVYPAGRPVKGGWVSSYYGVRTDPFHGRREHHKGMDFAGKAGSEVIAVAAGVVIWAGERSGYGKLIEINHGNGYVTRYGHNQTILVKVGDKVENGQLLARMGSSGRSTGPHVHFEVIRNGKVLNPLKYIRASR